MDRYLCIFEDKECTKCMDCEMCDLDPEKVCNSCGKCIESDAEYRAIDVDVIEDGVIQK